jgi:hypothetical protein
MSIPEIFQDLLDLPVGILLELAADDTIKPRMIHTGAKPEDFGIILENDGSGFFHPGEALQKIPLDQYDYIFLTRWFLQGQLLWNSTRIARLVIYSSGRPETFSCFSAMPPRMSEARMSAPQRK